MSNNIPLFGLYGEDDTDNPQFVHIEKIARRSSLNGWQIQPHRHARMFQLVLMQKGGVEVRLDDQSHTSEQPCVISIPAGVVHSFKFKPETQGYVLTLAEPLVLAVEPRVEHLFAPLFEQPHLVLYANENPLFMELMQLLTQIGLELARTDTGRSLMCEWLSRAALMTLKRRLDQLDAETELASGVPRSMRKFRQLIEQHYSEHWTVERYASVLGISADRLNRQAKVNFNTNAKALIAERLLLEAKRRLIYTRASLEEIAYDLGFKDPAYFSRRFKQATGLTPGRFRALNYDAQDIDA